MEEERTVKITNILDAVHLTLDPQVFDDPASPEPKLKPAHAHWIKTTIEGILTEGGYTDVEKWLSLYLTGSLTTYQYSENSDVDVSIFVDTKVFPDWSRAEIIGLMVEHADGQVLPGTSFPLQVFVVPPDIKPTDLYKAGLRSGYDIFENKWVVPPEPERIHDVETEQNGMYTWALQGADKMERLLRHEPDKAILYWHQIHNKRRQDHKAGKGDFSESNILYKFLAKRGLLPDIAEKSGEYIAKTSAISNPKKFETTLEDHNRAKAKRLLPKFFRRSAVHPDWLKEWIRLNGPYMFHNTKPEVIPAIQRDGLIPHDQGPGSKYYEQLVPRANHSYAYAPGSPLDVRVPRVGIDLRKIDPNTIHADEDAYTGAHDDGIRDEFGLDSPDSYRNYGAFADHHKLNSPEHVVHSLDRHGTLAIEGGVPPEAIVKDHEAREQLEKQFPPRATGHRGIMTLPSMSAQPDGLSPDQEKDYMHWLQFHGWAGNSQFDWRHDDFQHIAKVGPTETGRAMKEWLQEAATKTPEQVGVDYGIDNGDASAFHQIATQLFPQQAQQAEPSQLQPAFAKTADAPKKPPHYRLATKSPKCCLTCKMFHNNKCWGYGNHPVKEDHVCDSWKKGSIVDSPGFFSAVAPTPSPIAMTAYDAVFADGGITIGLNGTQMTQGFAFCPTKATEVKMPLPELTPPLIDQFIQTNMQALSQPGNYLGLWVDKGLAFIDVSQVVHDKDRALALAEANQQLAIFDLSTHEEIRISNNDERGSDGQDATTTGEAL